MTRRKLRRGDIVLATFPFTNLKASKLRPALVVSPGLIGNDVVLVAVSSVISATPEATDLVVESSHPDFGATGLTRASVIRAHKIVTIERQIVVRRLGRASAALLLEIDARLGTAIGIHPPASGTP